MLKLEIFPFHKIPEQICCCKPWQLKWGVRGNNVADYYYLEELAVFILTLRIYDMLNFSVYQGYLPWILDLMVGEKEVIISELSVFDGLF